MYGPHARVVAMNSVLKLNLSLSLRLITLGAVVCLERYLGWNPIWINLQYSFFFFLSCMCYWI